MEAFAKHTLAQKINDKVVVEAVIINAREEETKTIDEVLKQT